MDKIMMTLELRESDVHEINVDGGRLLFHVPTTALFELDTVTAELLSLFREKRAVTEEELRHRFDGRATPDEIIEALGELLDLGVIGGGETGWRERAPMLVRATPLSTIVLNVNTGCNLSCTYCYKEDLATHAEGQRMSLDTAVGAFELLLHEAANRPFVNV